MFHILLDCLALELLTVKYVFLHGNSVDIGNGSDHFTVEFVDEQVAKFYFNQALTMVNDQRSSAGDCL